MRYWIERDPLGATLPRIKNYRIVHDDYTQTPKLFPTHEIANEYATLSQFRNVVIQGAQ